MSDCGQFMDTFSCFISSLERCALQQDKSSVLLACHHRVLHSEDLVRYIAAEDQCVDATHLRAVDIIWRIYGLIRIDLVMKRSGKLSLGSVGCNIDSQRSWHCAGSN